MVSKTITIQGSCGMHLRPATVLCNKAITYQSDIRFSKDGGRANAKSVLSVLGACIRPGDEITFICEGPDEEEALAGILEVLQDGLNKYEEM